MLCGVIEKRLPCVKGAGKNLCFLPEGLPLRNIHLCVNILRNSSQNWNLSNRFAPHQRPPLTRGLGRLQFEVQHPK